VTTTRQAPGPPATQLFTLLRGLQKDPVRFFEGLRREFGPVVRIPFAHKQVFLITDPDALKQVLQLNAKNYRKSEMFNRERKAALGESLLTSEGPHWFKQRKLAQPAFKRPQLNALVNDMAQVTARNLDGWRPHVERGRPFDIAEELTKLTIHIASKTLFGVDVGDKTDAICESVAVLVRAGAERMATLLRLPLFVPLPSHQRIKAALRTLDDIVYGVIRLRRADGGEGKADVLSLMLRAKDEETGRGMSDEELRDEVTTFLIAGHESTASGLAWTTWLLATHPGAEARVRAEAAAALGERLPTADDLPNLSYTRRVVQESLRLYPPSWLFDREAIADDELGGFHIPAGATLCILPWLQHRDPAVWEDPERFDPDRFLPDRGEGRPTFAYCPFSGGPRKCIGDEFALQESTIVLSMLTRRYRVAVVPSHPIELLTLIALRPRHGVQVTLHEAGDA
jgi:cytochrome P450